MYSLAFREAGSPKGSSERSGPDHRKQSGQGGKHALRMAA